MRKQYNNADTFCAKCGTRQAIGAKAANSGDVFEKNVIAHSVDLVLHPCSQVGSLLSSYSPLHDRQEERDVRFHAFQGLYLFVVWLMVDWVFQPIFHAMPGPNPMRAMVGLMRVVVFGAWIWMIIKTAQEQMFRLPIVGDLAERSVAEQR